MATPFERVKVAWESPDRVKQLNHVVEIMAAEGVSRDQLDDALGKLLDDVRDAVADDDTEEIINNVGDRLHGWCHISRHIKTHSDTVQSNGTPAARPNVTSPTADNPNG